MEQVGEGAETTQSSIFQNSKFTLKTVVLSHVGVFSRTSPVQFEIFPQIQAQGSPRTKLLGTSFCNLLSI